MRRWSAILGLVIFVGIMAPLFGSAALTRGAGDPVLPDLRTLPPANLSLTSEKLDDGRSHYLLRFDNTIGNFGGPLEIVANLQQSRDLYQNVYDAYDDGTIVSTTKVSSDLIFHPTHNHFHFQDFAVYVLLKKDASGVYTPTARQGTKTSFCIIDSVRVASLGTGASTHRTCDAKKQGLSAGWGDTYKADLPEQWIDFGTSRPESGDYAIQSTADPLNKLLESNDTNNTGLTYFTIRSGRLANTDTTPDCTVTPASGPVGTAATLACVRFTPGEVLDIRWGSQANDIIQRLTIDDTGSAAMSFTIPVSPLGVHSLYATSELTERTRPATFSTTPALSLGTASGNVGDTLQFAVTGFAPNETMPVRYTISGSTKATLATLTTDSDGSATGQAAIPASALGAHQIAARGSISKKTVTGTYAVSPSASLDPTSVAAGGTFGVHLDGFKKSETVTITLVETSTKLKSIHVGSTGAANISTANTITVPTGLAPGAYTIRATGSSSHLSVDATLQVTGQSQSVDAAESDVATPTERADDPTPTPKPRHRTRPSRTTLDETAVATAAAGAESGDDAAGTPAT